MINQHTCCTLLFYGGFPLHHVGLKRLHVCNIFKSKGCSEVDAILLHLWPSRYLPGIMLYRSKTFISTTGLVTLILHIPVWNSFAHVEILLISECTVPDASYMWWFLQISRIQLITLMDNSPCKNGTLVYLQLIQQSHRWSGCSFQTLSQMSSVLLLDTAYGVCKGNIKHMQNQSPSGSGPSGFWTNQSKIE